MPAPLLRCKYGCGTVMSPERAEGGTHYEWHRSLGDTVKVSPGAPFPEPVIFGLWYGGSGYAHSYLDDDLEVFRDVDDAEDAMSGRALRGYWQLQDFNFADGRREQAHTPNVNGSKMELFLSDPRDMLGGATPDLTLVQGEDDEITRRSA